MNPKNRGIVKLFKKPNNMYLANMFIENHNTKFTQKEICEKMERDYSNNLYRENLKKLKQVGIIKRTQRKYKGRQHNTFEYYLNKDSEIPLLIKKLNEKIEENY